MDDEPEELTIQRGFIQRALPAPADPEESMALATESPSQLGSMFFSQLSKIEIDNFLFLNDMILSFHEIVRY